MLLDGRGLLGPLCGGQVPDDRHALHVEIGYAKVVELKAAESDGGGRWDQGPLLLLGTTDVMTRPR